MGVSLIKSFLLMSKDDTLAEKLTQFTQQNHWQLTQVTTATAVVTDLEKHSYTGLFWDLATANLDTTIATMTLIRPEFNGPLLVFSPTVTDRERRKLYRAKVDDILRVAIPTTVLRPLVEQRCWLYQRDPAPEQGQATGKGTAPATGQPVITIGNWQFDPDRVRVTKNGHPVSLTRKEFQLLEFFIGHRGQVLSREQLLSGIWGYDILGSSRIVDIHVSHLRDKLEDDSQHPVHLQTVRGFGYKLE